MEMRMKIKNPRGDLSIIAQGKEGSLPLLFLHADCGRATQWQAVLDRLAASRKVYALDFHGNGDSAPATNGDYSYVEPYPPEWHRAIPEIAYELGETGTAQPQPNHANCALRQVAQTGRSRPSGLLSRDG
jgi:hypothetical protein